MKTVHYPFWTESSIDVLLFLVLIRKSRIEFYRVI